jgi:S1-C subfamily serine protease
MTHRFRMSELGGLGWSIAVVVTLVALGFPIMGYRTTTGTGKTKEMEEAAQFATKAAEDAKKAVDAMKSLRPRLTPDTGSPGSPPVIVVPQGARLVAPSTGTQPVDGYVFRHLAGAYTLPLPANAKAEVLLDELGYYGYDFFLRDQTVFGGPVLRVYAIPLPHGSKLTLDLDSCVRLANRLLPLNELRFVPRFTLGPLVARSFEESSPSRLGQCEIRVAAGKDYVYVVRLSYASGQRAEWCDAALAGFAIPAAPEPAWPRAKAADSQDDLARRLKPAVPRVLVLARVNRDDPSEGNLTEIGSGSGVILTEDGYLVTNRHVIERKEVRVPTPRGPQTISRFALDPVKLEWDPETKLTSTLADVVAVSYTWDLALLRIRGGRKWVSVPMADPRRVTQDQEVMVAGWPALADLGHVFYTNRGRLNAHPEATDGRPRIYVHSAGTNVGNSGGLLYDLTLGGMVGVLSVMIPSDDNGFRKVIAYGAVPLERVIEEFPQVLRVTQARPTPSECGARISTFFHAGRPTAALVECEQLLRDDPKSRLAKVFKLRILAQNGEPDAVTRPLYEAASADPETRSLAERWECRAYLEAADWGKLHEQYKRRKSAQEPRLNFDRFEDNLLNAYCGGRTFSSLENPRTPPNLYAPLSTSQDPRMSAEAEVMIAVEGIRKWMLEKRVTTLPAEVKPSPEDVEVWRRRLDKGFTLWPSFHEMAGLYLAYLEALLGNMDKADDLFRSAMAAGRRDRFFLSNAVYFRLRTKTAPVDAYLLATMAHSLTSPGTHFMLGQSLRQLADWVRKVDLTDKVIAQVVEFVATDAEARGLVPARTKIADLAAALETAGERLESEGLAMIDFGPYRFARPDIAARGLLNPDNWWGPFMALIRNRRDQELIDRILPKEFK